MKTLISRLTIKKKTHLITSMIFFFIIGYMGLVISYPILGVVTLCTVLLALAYALIYHFIKTQFNL